MTEQEHLQKIKARCEALLMENQTLAKTQPCGCVVCTCDDPVQCHGCGASNCGWHPPGEIPNQVFNLTEAEAGWRATIAAIDLAFYSMGFIPAHQITFKPMIDAIRAAWPVELLQIN